MGRADQGHPVHLVDASIFIFRAWFSLPPEAWTNAEGAPLNAVVGWGRYLLDFLANQGPGVQIAALFDESLTTSFRNQLYPAYKGNRERPDAALKAQMGWCRELADAAGVVTWSEAAYEADDLIASIQGALDRPVVIHTRDKDLGQLLGPGDRLRDPDGKFTGVAEFTARFGVTPALFPDWQALAGDAVDNVPGVSGVGAKTATALVQAFGDLEAVLAAAAEGAILPVRRDRQVRADLIAQADDARLYRQLVQLRGDLPLPFPTTALDWTGATAELSPMLERLGLERTLGRLAKATGSANTAGSDGTQARKP